MEIDSQIIFLILFVIIGGVKWVIEQIQANRHRNQEPGESEDNGETLEDIYEEFREEIRNRQTRVPQEETPPPLPRAAPPAPAPFTGFKAPAHARPQNFKVDQPNLSQAEKTALQNFQELGRKTSNNNSRGSNNDNGSIRAMLADPASAKKAIVLKEILGEPRSMQHS